MTKRARLGMAMFLMSATVFFFLLILACAYFRAIPRLTYTQGLVSISIARREQSLRMAGMALGRAGAWRRVRGAAVWNEIVSAYRSSRAVCCRRIDLDCRGARLRA